MKQLIKIPFYTALIFGVLSLNACLESDRDNASMDAGPTPSVQIPETEPGELPKNMTLRAAPTLNSVELEWNAVEGAVDYQVSRELQDSSNGAIEILTGGARNFSFSTSGKETYKVWITAINDQGAFLGLSKIVKVISADPDAVLLSDQGQ